MRRCLHRFFIGLLTLSLVTAPAHACWRSRQARPCRPVQVVPAWQPAPWSDCCEPCGIEVVGSVAVVEAVDCCSTVAPATGCSPEMVVMAESQPAAAERFADTGEDVVSIVESQPTITTEAPVESSLAAAATLPPSLEPIAPPSVLEPAGGVTPASNHQPLAEQPAPAEAAELAVQSVLAEPAMRTEPDTEPRLDARERVEPQGDAPGQEDGKPALSADQAATTPVDAVPIAGADAEHAPAEPEAALEDEPEAAAAQDPEPATREINIFEELDAREASTPPGDEQDIAEEPAADPFGDEPTAPQAPASEPADPEADEQETATAESVAEEGLADEEMTDEEAAAEAEPVDPFAADDEEAAPPSEPGTSEPDSEPDSEPQAADPFAATESPRRWIDATGAGSIVATLVDVAGEGACVLETRGRHVVVPLEKLSRHDRDYVLRAGSRLAKQAGQEPTDAVAAVAPVAADTAGL